MRDQYGDTKNYSLTGASIIGKNFVEIDGTWYTSSGKNLESIDPENPKTASYLTHLDSVDFIQKIDRELIFIGKK